MSRGTSRSWRATVLALVVALLLTIAAPAVAEPLPVPDNETVQESADGETAGEQAGEEAGQSVGEEVAGGEAAGEEVAGQPAGAALDQLGKDLAKVRHEAETAEQRSTAAGVQLERRKKESADAAAEADHQRARVEEAETQAARLVAEQYRNGPLGSLGPLARLFLSERAEDFLGHQHQAFERSHSAADVLNEVREARGRLVLAAEQARQAEEAAAAAAQDSQQAVEQARTAAARTAQLLDSTPADQLELLEQLDYDRADESRQQMLAAGVFGPGGSASEAGRKAIAFALGQRDKPYLWGGTGPDAFDCSGLTSQAWLAAGVPVPRTSQEQWAALHRIPLRDLRPGDLIIYQNDASHVALYVGGGTVVHAPHPGTVIKLAPITMLPILGAVRPDPESPSAS
ncbi:C40 family peptidase [Kitasatospora sp. NPDC048407]|uniref:C40 family peptidase n=1 Tax=Kitasatospora sp. NPDC048407 TaxID=3364051 RepID=UPI003716C937